MYVDVAACSNKCNSCSSADAGAGKCDADGCFEGYALASDKTCQGTSPSHVITHSKGQYACEGIAF